LSEDFFHVDAYPAARFFIREVVHESSRLYRIAGDLTIRDRTQPVRFYGRGWEVSASMVRAEARLEVDRHAYGVSYRGSTIRDDLVDDSFWLELTIEARRPEVRSEE
jgi:polyisoprenoid-binding protein YceI